MTEGPSCAGLEASGWSNPLLGTVMVLGFDRVAGLKFEEGLKIPSSAYIWTLKKLRVSIEWDLVT